MLLDGFVEELAFAGRAQSTMVKVEQFELGCTLQFRNAAADRGLRGVEHECRAGGCAHLHDRLEGFDLLKIQVSGHIFPTW